MDGLSDLHRVIFRDEPVPGCAMPEVGHLRPFEIRSAEDAAALREFGIDVVVDGAASEIPIATLWIDPGSRKRDLRINLRGNATRARIVLDQPFGLSGTVLIHGRDCVLVDCGHPERGSKVVVNMWTDGCAFYWGRGCTGNGIITEMNGDGQRVIVAEDCMFATDISIRPTDMHAMFDLASKEVLNGSKLGRVILEPHVWIGQGVLVTKDVRIGAGSIIGADAIVTRDVPRRSLAVGAPARHRRSGVSWSRQLTPSKRDMEQVEQYLDDICADREA